MKMEKRPARAARVLKRRVEVQISGKALIDYVQRHYILVYSIWYNLSVEKVKEEKEEIGELKQRWGPKGTKREEQKQFVFRLRRWREEIHVSV